MKLLVAGNSQAGALRLALQEGIVQWEDMPRPHFYVVPGGTGPTFLIKDGKFTVSSFVKDFPPYADPEDVADAHVGEYDAILVSALGFVDGGFRYKNAIMEQGHLAEFGPRAGEQGSPLLSQACFAEIVHYGLLRHPGFIFLKRLREEFAGQIVVQPFPYPSEYLAEREDWPLRQVYEDFLSFNRYLYHLRDQALGEICSDLRIDLLPVPNIDWASECFTPRELMRDGDALHPLPAYGALVMRQVHDYLTDCQMPSGRKT